MTDFFISLFFVGMVMEELCFALLCGNFCVVRLCIILEFQQAELLGITLFFFTPSLIKGNHVPEFRWAPIRQNKDRSLFSHVCNWNSFLDIFLDKTSQ